MYRSDEEALRMRIEAHHRELAELGRSLARADGDLYALRGSIRDRFLTWWTGVPRSFPIQRPRPERRQLVTVDELAQREAELGARVQQERAELEELGRQVDALRSRRRVSPSAIGLGVLVVLGRPVRMMARLLWPVVLLLGVVAAITHGEVDSTEPGSTDRRAGVGLSPGEDALVDATFGGFAVVVAIAAVGAAWWFLG